MRRPVEDPTATRPRTEPELSSDDSFLRRWWRGYFTETRREADAASTAYLAATPSRVADRKAGVVLVSAALALTSINYATDPSWVITLASALGLDGAAVTLERWFSTSVHQQFNGLMFWAVIQVAGYVLIPVLVIRLVLGERVGGYGLRWRGVWRQGGIYLFLSAVSVPFIVFASSTVAFQERYPFYELAPGEGLWPRMALWWIAYAAQFVALEFFFRGFMVHGLKQRLGYMAVFAMIVPYNMLHYQKPVLEALAAVGGGYILGSMSLKTRSIWWGAALHIMVAGTLDLLSLLQKGLL